jgi:hypothetical protein
MAEDAVRLLGIDQGHLSAVLNGKRRSVGGFVFRYVDEPDFRVRQMPATADPTPVALSCPPSVGTATGTFDPAGYDHNDCTGCGCPREEH